MMERRDKSEQKRAYNTKFDCFKHLISNREIERESVNIDA
jgi:hypothetical protein